MSKRLAALVLTLACGGTITAAAIAQATSLHPAVKPRAGKRSTRFTVTFQAPRSTSQSGTSGVRYVVSASTRAHSSRCVSSISVQVATATAGSPVHVKLNPKRAGGSWCRGRFHGRIEEFIYPSCGCPAPGPPTMAIVCANQLCPAIMIPAPQTIGKFRFRVHK